MRIKNEPQKIENKALFVHFGTSFIIGMVNYTISVWKRPKIKIWSSPNCDKMACL